ncbi:MAG: LacI family DNA-binding transcriptional regulator [Pseudomonadota bacterium]
MAADRVTSLDVARAAGVSQSAVSRVYTPGASVSPATAAKVRDAAARLGYRPNVLARSLITGRSRIIGLVVAYLENQFYPGVLEKLSNALQARGFHVMIFMAGQGEDAERVLDELLDYQVDGIVAASVTLSSGFAARCEGLGVPVVLFNRVQDDPRLSAVASDNRAGGALAAQALVRAGGTRFAYIAGLRGSSTQRDREAGLRSFLAAGGLALHARADADYDPAAAARAARAMFRRPDRPDAVFVANDHMAFAVMDVLRHDLGLRIPQDVAVVGYDDTPPAAWPSYDLTTVRQPAADMVHETVDALLHRIETPDAPPRRVMLPATLVQRGSAAPQALRP